MSERADALNRAIDALYAVSALLDPIRLRVWDAEGLTVTQLRLLAYVGQSEGISNAELADRLYVTRPSVSALLERLERGGFLRREISQSDRRGICIWLEERGRNAVSNLREETRQYTANLMDDLAVDDLLELERVFGKLVKSGQARRQRDLAADRTAP